MTKKTRPFIVVLIVVILIITLRGINIFDKKEGRITFLDYPKNLSKKTETIELGYIDWACACANWLPKTNSETLDDTEIVDNCIFIEADNKAVKISEENKKGHIIKLTGSFYKDEGISRDYVKQTSEKPKPAKVFKYTKAEIIK